MDDFGTWDELDEYEPETFADDREVCPEGRHEFSIQRIRTIYGTDGSERLEITLKHPEARYWPVSASPEVSSKGWRRLAGSLAKALGMSGRALAAAIRDGDLVGRQVVARVWHKEGTTGRVFANVGEFHAAGAEATAPAPVERATAAPGERKPAKRTPKQKAEAASSAVLDDDIPF